MDVLGACEALQKFQSMSRSSVEGITAYVNMATFESFQAAG